MLIYRDDIIKVYASRMDASSEGEKIDNLPLQRQMVNRLLSEAFPGFTPGIRHLPSGAPVLEGVPGEWGISVTHCHQIVAVAICRTSSRIGIDVDETSRGNQLRRVAPRFLSASQLAEWTYGDESLLFAWSIKEAIYKAAGIPGLPLSKIPLPDPLAFTSNRHGKVVYDDVSYDLLVMPDMAGCGPIVLALGNKIVSSAMKN